MKILHLNSNFVFNDFYKNLLDSQNPEIENIIFCPLKRKLILKVMGIKYLVL